MGCVELAFPRIAPTLSGHDRRMDLQPTPQPRAAADNARGATMVDITHSFANTALARPNKIPAGGTPPSDQFTVTCHGHAGAATARELAPLAGNYVGSYEQYRIEVTLKVDISRAVVVLNADFYALDDASDTRVGACVLHSSRVVSDAHGWVIKGLGQFTFAAAAPLLEVSIGRCHGLAQHGLPARVKLLVMRFFTFDLRCGGVYKCAYQSQNVLMSCTEVRLQPANELRIAPPATQPHLL